MSHLTQQQRYAVKGYLTAGLSQNEIALQIGVPPSTVCRELARNGEQNGDYEPGKADSKARLRHKRNAYRLNTERWVYVEARLREYHSPEQISGRAKLEGVDMVSHETIYLHLYKERRNGHDLTFLLRRNQRERKKRNAAYSNRGQISDKVTIDKRPAEVEKRERIGDIEADLVIGKDHKMAVLTAVDLASRFLFASLIDDKSSLTVSTALIELLKNQTIKTITTDNGKEFTDHKLVAKELNAEYFFAFPNHSWERGTNENTNGLLRQFIPKNRPLDSVTYEQLQNYVNLINNRPRKVLGYKSTLESFQELSINHFKT